jgi:hydrogenase maturation factor
MWLAMPCQFGDASVIEVSQQLRNLIAEVQAVSHSYQLIVVNKADKVGSLLFVYSGNAVDSGTELLEL